MRLTLRTLLAWLDDTLSPSEVREIGKQVADSQFAKDLVERIHRVNRQRRLTVPSRAGGDSTDANLVASYLDNELPPDEVTEFEKRCLMSDVHLAEVASAHQILSLIGQKAKVPIEARHRMYGLIKGRESVAPSAPRASHASEPEPVSEPIQPWVTPEPPRRPWAEQFGPTALVLALIVGLCWSAWKSLSPPEPVGGGRPIVSVRPPLALNPAGTAGAAAVPANPTVGPAPAAVAANTAPAPVAPMPEMPDQPKPEPTPAPETAAKPDLPMGVVGYAEKPTGVLLRFNRDTKEWVQLAAETPLKDQDRLLSLNPFRSTLTLGAARIDLVGESEITVLATPPNRAARIVLAQGRAVLHGTTPAEPFVVRVGKKNLEVTPPAAVMVGLARVNRREPGAAIAGEPAVEVFASEGDIALAVDDAKDTLSGPGVVMFDPHSSWTGKEAKPAPSWVLEPKLSPYDVQLGGQFQRYIRPDRPPIANLVEALDDDQKDVRKLAISALRAAGDVTYIGELLNRGDDPIARKSAISVLRAYIDQGPEALKALHEDLEKQYGAGEVASTFEKLLLGFTAKEAKEEPTYAKLVSWLGSPEPGIRELALDNLQSLTGRDALEYDPDRPDGKGLKVWKDLLRDHELRAAPAAKGTGRAETKDQP